MEYERDRRRRNELCVVMGFPGNPETGRRQIATLYFAVMAIRHVYQVACGPRIISSAFWTRLQVSASSLLPCCSKAEALCAASAMALSPWAPNNFRA